MTPTSSTTKSGAVTGNVPADSGATFFSARKPASASIGTIMREAADQHRQAEQGVVVVGRPP